MKFIGGLLAVLCALATGNAQAELFDRGGGLLYDNVLNVTWLQDANYAKTSGYDADGRMDWNSARTWADNLTFGGYSDWRLPSIKPIGDDWNFYVTLNGSSDFGYNITSPRSELSYMYYVNLGFKGFISPTGLEQSDFGISGHEVVGGEADVGLVRNLQSATYWSETVYPLSNEHLYIMIVDRYGTQANGNQYNQFAAWAVRPGDVTAPIPEPETYAMLLVGLGLLGAVASRRKQKSFA